jgi:hypothetical protein
MNTAYTSISMPYKVYLIGGSQNIGYHSALRLMGKSCPLCCVVTTYSLVSEQGHIVTYLLRSPSKFDEDSNVQKYVKSGHARLVKGDALVEADVRRGWEQAGKGGPIEGAVDFLLSTVGKSLLYLFWDSQF